MKLLSLFIITLSVCSLFAQQQPKLVVGIVVDQMCYEYLYRYQSKFSKNGFKKLMNNGTVCQNAQYNYVPTYTGPGHASIYTGTTPSNHGIVANEWYQRSLKKEVNCVDDSTVKAVGTSSNDGIKSPKNLIANTITDQLRLTYSKSKVISVSIKDRGAILPGGHLSNGSYWFDYSTGSFITSSFFKDELPQWVRDFNGENRVDAYLKQTWKTLLPIETYTESEKDNSIYELPFGGKKTPEFPYNLAELNKGRTTKELFAITPFSNTYLTDFAIKAMKAEQLGADNVPDFLAISYSTPDIVGHSFGPYSIEIEDIYLRLDLELEKLIDQLESTVGKDNFVLFLTADHAVVPVPQYLTDKNLPGGYFYTTPLQKELETFLNQKYGCNPISEITNNNIYLNNDLLKEKGIDKAKLEKELAEIIQGKKGVKNVYTSSELMHPSFGDEWLSMIQRGYRHFESGDLIFTLEPGYLTKSEDSETSHKGTSHGSSYNYDTQVPLLWYGKNIPSQNIYRKVVITDITATLAPILFVQRPNACTGQPILELFE